MSKKKKKLSQKSLMDRACVFKTTALYHLSVWEHMGWLYIIYLCRDINSIHMGFL